MTTTVSGGGGGGMSYPGVTPDHNTPGGLIVEGGIRAGHVDIVADDLADALTITGAIGMVNNLLQMKNSDLLGVFRVDVHGSIEVSNRDNSTEALIISLVDDYTGEVMRINDVSNHIDLLTLTALGKLKVFDGEAIYNHPVPAAQPVLATGAGHTSDDIITILQSYGICKQS